MRRAFQLPEVDQEFLDSRAKPWDTVIEGGVSWVIIGDFDAPTSYNRAAVSVALRLLPAYPDVQIDMAYFCPDLARSDGKEIRGLSSLTLDGKAWQQWSRHRVPSEDAWRPGIDNIETHLRYVTAFLESELQK